MKNSILIAEDDEPLRKTMSVVLQQTGSDIVQVSNGADAMYWFEEQPFDIVITDIFMPERDGIELIRHIYASGAPTRLIAMTGDTGIVDYLEVATGLGAIRTLRKPFDNRQLLDAIHFCLQQPALPLNQTWPETLSHRSV